MKRLLFLFLFSALTCKAYPMLPVDSINEAESSRLLLFPFFIKSPETSLGFGAAGAYFFKAKKNEPTDRTSDISLIALYTLRKQVVLVLNSTVYFRGEEQIFRAQVSNSYYPDRFWGLGNSTLSSAKEDYSIHQYFINPQFLFRGLGKLYFGLNLDFQHVYDFSYLRGGVFDVERIIGRNGGDVTGAGALLTWDKRNNAYSPDKGSFAELNSTYYRDWMGSDFNFSAHTIDLRSFFRISSSTVWAMQSILRKTSGKVPIRNLSMIGGSEMMRGYWKGRFADKNMVALQSEIRQFLFWRIGVVGFGGIAQVSDRVSRFGLSEFHWAAGGGLRFMLKKKEKLNLRIDYGIGEYSSGLYVILKEAF